MGLISNEDLGRVVSGDIKEDEEGDISVKTSLEIVNLLTNMYSVRKEAMESALRCLFTNSKDSDFQGEGTSKKLSKLKMDLVRWINVRDFVNNCRSKADSLVISEAMIDEYDLGEFSISDSNKF